MPHFSPFMGYNTSSYKIDNNKKFECYNSMNVVAALYRLTLWHKFKNFKKIRYLHVARDLNMSRMRNINSLHAGSMYHFGNIPSKLLNTNRHTNTSSNMHFSVNINDLKHNNSHASQGAQGMYFRYYSGVHSKHASVYNDILSVYNAYNAYTSGNGRSGNHFIGNIALDGLCNKGVYKMLNANDFRKIKRITRNIVLDASNFTSAKNILSQYPVAMPVHGVYMITSGYEMRMHPMRKRMIMHKGIDIISYDSRVYAVGSGRVIRARYSRQYGNMVAIKHRNGYISRYAHLRRMRVRVGQNVQLGALIGIMGSSGMSTGKHLHLEIIKDKKHIDPSYIFA